MNPLTTANARSGLIFVMLFCSTLSSQFRLVDDHSDGTNGNEFDYYWYYYDDLTGLGEYDRLQADPQSQPSVIDVPYVLEHREAYGDPADTLEIKNYEFTINEENGNRFATMPFTFGNSWETTLGTSYPYVGMVTMLAAEGKSIDLSEMTGVKFRIRSRKEPLNIVFKVQTLDIKQDSSQAYYQDTISVTTEWSEKTVAFEKIKQPAWAQNLARFDFDLCHCTKLVWEVQQITNTSLKYDTLDLDDIYLVPAPPSPYLWLYTASLNPPTNYKFATFETLPRNVTPLGTYWYAFDDSLAGGQSQIFAGAKRNPMTVFYDLIYAEGTGFNSDYGIAIECLFGPDISKNCPPVHGFASLAFDLYDSASADYLNLSSKEFASIYFDYRTDEDIDRVSLEILDFYDVRDRNDPSRESPRSSGNVWFRDLPLTNSSWRAVNIPFD